MSISEYLQAKRKLVEAATAGPWKERVVRDILSLAAHFEKPDECAKDAAFIADSRTTMPKLLAALERAVKHLEYNDDDTAETLADIERILEVKP